MENKAEPKINVDIGPGRWGKTYYITDSEGSKIKLKQKEALSVARQIIKEEGKKGGKD